MADGWFSGRARWEGRTGKLCGFLVPAEDRRSVICSPLAKVPDSRLSAQNISSFCYAAVLAHRSCREHDQPHQSSQTHHNPTPELKEVLASIDMSSWVRGAPDRPHRESQGEETNRYRKYPETSTTEVGSSHGPDVTPDS